MKPSDHPHSNHPASFLSPRIITRDVRAEDEACAPDFATHPRSSADVFTPLARHHAWPNRVHFCLGLVFRLGLLSTPPRGNAVTLGYPVVARFNWNWTFTVWFHRVVIARSGALKAPLLKAKEPHSPRPCRVKPVLRIEVGMAHWLAPPLPPNRTCGFPASGSPVSSFYLLRGRLPRPRALRNCPLSLPCGGDALRFRFQVAGFDRVCPILRHF